MKVPVEHEKKSYRAEISVTTWICWFTSSAPIKSRIETFWYRLTQDHLEKMAIKMERERRTQRIVGIGKVILVIKKSALRWIGTC